MHHFFPCRCSRSCSTARSCRSIWANCPCMPFPVCCCSASNMSSFMRRAKAHVSASEGSKPHRPPRATAPEGAWLALDADVGGFFDGVGTLPWKWNRGHCAKKVSIMAGQQQQKNVVSTFCKTFQRARPFASQLFEASLHVRPSFSQ